MSYRPPYTDPQSERLLFVVLERQKSGSSHRHIRASVIRRAVAHRMTDVNDKNVITVTEWFDDYPEKCAGYRNASWVFKGATPLFVDDMQLRGQIDLCANPLRGGKPYGNEVRFTPYQVCAQTAAAINVFYQKYGKFLDKHQVARCPDDFVTAVQTIATFLGITRFVFTKQGYSGDLSQPQNFEEMGIVDAARQIDKMLLPFVQNQDAE